MKHVKIYETNIEHEKFYFDSIFYFLKYLDGGKESIEFLKSLNLTETQCSKLAEIIEDYGRNQYYEGRNDEYSTSNEY